MKPEFGLNLFSDHQVESMKSSTCLQNMVGVNFKQNPSLRDRYGEYLQSRSLFSSRHSWKSQILTYRNLALFCQNYKILGKGRRLQNTFLKMIIRSCFLAFPPTLSECVRKPGCLGRICTVCSIAHCNTKISHRRVEFFFSSPLTCSSGLLLSTPSCLVAKVASSHGPCH